MEKYYIAYQMAESESEGVVKLTDEEFKAVTKFLDQVSNFEDRSYCGTCGINPTPYATEEEAREKLYCFCDENDNSDQD